MNNIPYYSVEQDHNGLWFVLNENGFPISVAFERQTEAMMELERYIDND